MIQETKMTPAQYLKRPYSRGVVPESDGTYRSEILEFPGCIASADTAVQSLCLLEDVAESWLESALARGNVIPEPMEENEFSGKLVLRLAKSIHHKAAKAARADGVSLNTFIANCVAEQLGCRRGSPMTRTLDSRTDQAVAAMLQPEMQRASPGSPNASVIDASVVNSGDLACDRVL